MDEPFGAVDPLTRDRLQQQFLDLQKKIRKTIVLVTHDIDEAIKLGDRIAILRPQDGSPLVQYDTPGRILSAPANDFVRDFLGNGIVLKWLSLSRVKDIDAADEWPTVRADTSDDGVRDLLARTSCEWLLLLDDSDRPQRWLSADDLRGDQDRVGHAGKRMTNVLSAEASLQEALQIMLTSESSAAVTVDEHGRYRGVIYMQTLNKMVNAMHAEACLPDPSPALAQVEPR
jgi:osmoprotectant transport system ATP-binding protein